MRSAARGGQDLLGGSVLGDGLGAFGDGVLGELQWKEDVDSGLDFAGRDRGLGVVLGELGGFGGDALEDVVEFMMSMPLDEMPVSGWTCLSTL